MDLAIERPRKQDAIPLPCEQSWRTIVGVLCGAFQAVEKMDLVIVHDDYLRPPCERTWRTIVHILCDAFEAVEKWIWSSSTIITSDSLSPHRHHLRPSLLVTETIFCCSEQFLQLHPIHPLPKLPKSAIS